MTRSPRCTIAYDVEPHLRRPKAGEYLVSEGQRGLGSAYLIEHVREVRRRSRRGLHVQYSLRCLRISKAEVTGEYWPLFWYPREKKA